jgi:hypothetical protein
VNPTDLPELLLSTELDLVQVAHLAELSLGLVAGCHDAMRGSNDGKRLLRRRDAEPNQWRDYAEGHRLAAEWARAPGDDLPF